MEETALYRKRNIILKYFFLTVLLLIMLYPIFWLVGASMKESEEIFGNPSILPDAFDLSGYKRALEGISGVSMAQFMGNSLVLTTINVLVTVASSCFIAYGFARFDFKGKKLFFILMIGTMMLPNAVLIIPRYMVFNQLHWLNSYLTFWAPSLLGVNFFNIYMMIQFYRGIPKELDEAAKLDGCGSFQILVRIILPLSKPAVMSIGVLQFLWTWNDYFNSLIYINKVSKYPVSIGLQLMLGYNSVTDWQKVLAAGFMSIIPCVIVYAALQKYLVQGTVTAGLKG